MVALLAMTSEVVKLCLYYGTCLLIVFITLLMIGILKRRTKKEMRADRVLKSCQDAKQYAEALLQTGGKKSAQLLFASTKLMHLESEVLDAAWYAFQIVYAKKDIFFEGIANQLDSIANDIAEAATDGYIPMEEYEKCVQKAVENLQNVVEKLEGLS